MYFISRTYVVLLLAIGSVGFNITIPSPISAGEVKSFQWTWNSTDSSASPAGAFVSMVINPPTGFQCNTGLRTVGNDIFTKIVESSATARNPTAGSFGSFLLSPRHPGPHILCTFGNLPFINDPAPGASNFGSTFKALGNLTLLDESKFDVLQNTSTSSSMISITSVSAPMASPSGGDQSNHSDYDNHSRQNNDNTSVAEIVGGVLGGLTLVFMGLAFYFHRRLKYQRKLNQFHKEHMLLQQQPPPSFLSSGTMRVTSPPAVPLSAQRRSDMTTALEETVPKGSQLSSEDHSPRFSPPSYAAALPNEPVSLFTLRAAGDHKARFQV